MIASHPVFDVEREIVRTGNCPSPIDLLPWQARIDAIAGKTPDGKSRLRIVWGQEAEAYICGQRRKKYPFWRYMDGGEIVDIGVPRFYVEELHTNAELHKRDAWERARYFWDEVTGSLLDVLGPVPEEGFYTAVFMIAYHDDYCCGGRGHVKHEPCLGAFRPPSDEDLTRIRKIKYLRDHASNDQRAPSDTLIEKWTDEAAEKRDDRWRLRIREAIQDFMRTHSYRFTTDDPSELSWGKYKFTAAHSRSGLRKEGNFVRNDSDRVENSA